MKLILAILGMISLGIGLVGIVVPLLPTTPFLLLAAALFMRSSDRLYLWLTTNRMCGEYIRNYRENKQMPLRAKVISISLVWISLLYCTFFVVPELLYLQILLIALAIAVTWHLLSIGTTPKK